jgi:hypothetical protein
VQTLDHRTGLPDVLAAIHTSLHGCLEERPEQCLNSLQSGNHLGNPSSNTRLRRATTILRMSRRIAPCHAGEGRHRRGGHHRHPDGVFPDVGKLRLCRSSDGGLRRLLGSPAGAKLLGRRLVAAEQIAGPTVKTHDEVVVGV